MCPKRHNVTRFALCLKLVIEGKLYEVDVEVSEAEPRPPSYIPPAGRAALAPAASVPPPISSAAEPVEERVTERRLFIYLWHRI